MSLRQTNPFRYCFERTISENWWLPFVGAASCLFTSIIRKDSPDTWVSATIFAFMAIVFILLIAAVIAGIIVYFQNRKTK